MRTGNKLTALTVKNANKPGLYGDGHGLYLQVSSSRAKSWLFRFMRNGTARKMGLGPLHTVSLAEARKRAAEARLSLHDGQDPIDARAALRAAEHVERAQAITFEQCAAAFIAANETAWKNKKHRDQWRSTFRPSKRGQRLFPPATDQINALPVSTIDTDLIVKILEPIWIEKPETASRVRGRIEAILNWATVRGYRKGENPARWRGHLANVLPHRGRVRKVKHHAALPYDALPAFMRELRSKEGLSSRALEFTILTAARTSEAINAKWNEIDLDLRLWTIPSERMKAGKEHRVPLSARTVAVLRMLPCTSESVFTGST